MDRGYVKFWRKTTDSGFLQNPNLFTFWAWCLFKASHKKRNQLVGMTMVELQPGQFIFGRKAAASELKMSQQTIRTCLKKLEMFENLTIKSTNKFSIITIINWDTYQSSDEKITIKSTNSQPTSNQQVTSNQPASNHKQECNHLNIKECNNNNIPLNPPRGEVRSSKKKEFENYLIEKIKDTAFVKYQEKLSEFVSYRMSFPANKRYKTLKGVDGLLRSIGELLRAGLDPVECMDNAMEREWLIPSVDYFIKNNNGFRKKLTRSEQNKQACIDFIQGAPDYGEQ